MNSKNPVQRRYEIDWLRHITVFLLIPFHTARIFDIWEPFYAKNPQTSVALSYLIWFLNLWMMPLLFVIAGMSSRYALNFRSAGQYLSERFQRLFLPFIFGILAIVPPQAYIAKLKEPSYSNSYWEFLSGYFNIVPQDLSGYFGTLTPGHLWFILFLFVFSLVALPLLLTIKKSKRLVSRLAALTERPGMIFLIVLPLLLARAFPDIGGKKPFFDLLLFIIGFILASNDRFYQTIVQHKFHALFLAITTTFLLIFSWNWFASFPPFSPGSILFGLLLTLDTWCWILAFLGYGQHLLNFGNHLLHYANEASYPFYILHQTVVVAVGHLIVKLNWGVYPKFFVITIGSLLFTVLIYEVLIRRINGSRYLFGMKLIKKSNLSSLNQSPLSK